MFYAFAHKYNPIVRDTQGKRIGYVAVFAAKHQRDDFVSKFINAEAISSKVARACLIDELLAERPYMYNDVAYMGMSELVFEIEAARCDNWE